MNFDDPDIVRIFVFDGGAKIFRMKEKPGAAVQRRISIQQIAESKLIEDHPFAGWNRGIGKGDTGRLQGADRGPDCPDG